MQAMNCNLSGYGQKMSDLLPLYANDDFLSRDIEVAIRDCITSDVDPSHATAVKLRRQKLNRLFAQGGLMVEDRLMVFVIATLLHDKERLLSAIRRLPAPTLLVNVLPAVEFILKFCCDWVHLETDTRFPISLIPATDPGIASLCWRETRAIGDRTLDAFLALTSTRLLAIDPALQVRHQVLNVRCNKNNNNNNNSNNNNNNKDDDDDNNTDDGHQFYYESVFADGSYRTRCEELYLLKDFGRHGEMVSVLPSAGPFACYSETDIIYWLNARRMAYQRASGDDSRDSELRHRSTRACDLPQWPACARAGPVNKMHKKSDPQH